MGPGFRVVSREFSEELGGCLVVEASQAGAIVVGDEGVEIGIAFGMVEKAAVEGGTVLRHAAEMLPIVFSLVQEEGLVLGGSTGINVCGAIRLARELGPGHTIVTILADSGTRYQSKLFNPEFLKARDLPTPPWL